MLIQKYNNSLKIFTTSPNNFLHFSLIGAFIVIMFNNDLYVNHDLKEKYYVAYNIIL